MRFPIETLLQIGSYPLRTYSLLLSAGMATGSVLGLREAKRRKLDVRAAQDLILVGLAGGLGGAELYGAIQRGIDALLGVSADIGVVAYGGLLGAAVCMLLYAHWRKISWWPYADAFIPGVLLAIAIVRAGCFLRWDDYGVHTTLPWAVDGGDGPRHPTQIYLGLVGLILFLASTRMRKRELPPGGLFLRLAAAEAALRFPIEALRDEPHYALGLTAGQWTAAAIVGACLMALWRQKRSEMPRGATAAST